MADSLPALSQSRRIRFGAFAGLAIGPLAFLLVFVFRQQRLLEDIERLAEKDGS